MTPILQSIYEKRAGMAREATLRRPSGVNSRKNAAEAILGAFYAILGWQGTKATEATQGTTPFASLSHFPSLQSLSSLCLSHAIRTTKQPNYRTT